MNAKTLFKEHGGFVMTSLMAVGIAFALSGCGSGQKDLGPPEITTDVLTVLTDVARDLDFAEKKYDGKVVSLKGKVSSVTDISGYVYLQGPSIAGDRRISCSIRRGQPMPKRGETVTIIGVMKISRMSRTASMERCNIK